MKHSTKFWLLLLTAGASVLFATCMALDRPLLGATPPHCRAVAFATSGDSVFYEVGCLKGFKPGLP